MKKLFLSLLLLMSLMAIQAQTKPVGNIKGKVLDGQNKLPLPSATITILNKIDSAAAGFAVADKTGAFEIKNVPAGNYILGISFTGYQEFIRNIAITAARPSIDLDTVLLKNDTSMLASVIVSAPPITIKKDTVEFRASAFKTKPNATVEDLLKKLPGVEVDKEGNVTSQGEAIPKIYVDGKEFFGNDPKLATKNLTAEMVESIQVFDDMSDQAKFTRIDDGSRQKTINIKLKKDRKKGVFGRGTIGMGNEDLYTGSLSLNKFNNDMRISVVGGANNINRLGFSNTDIISNMGGMGGFSAGGGGGRGGGRRGGGGGSAGAGNTKSWSAGINYTDEWGSKMDFQGSYFVSGNTTTNRSKSHRVNTTWREDSTSIEDQDSYRKNESLNHRFGFRWEYEIDSMNSLLLTPTISVQQSESFSMDSSITYASIPKLNYKLITNASTRSNERDGTSFSNNLLFRHRFRKPGRTFTIGWNSGINDNNGEGLNESPYYFLNADGDTIRTRNQRQRNIQVGTSFNNTISTSITEMIDSSKILEFNYAYSINKNTSDRDTYEWNPRSMEYDSVNENQTNYFENVNVFNRIGTNFRYRKEKYSLQIGGAVQFASLENMSHRESLKKDSMMRQKYVNFFPNASFNYNMGTRKSIRVNYRGSTRAPSITQLQDFRDESNVLNIREGNPDLKQEFNNNLSISWNSYNMTNFMYTNLEIAAGTIGNKIVNSIDSLDGVTTLTKPENVNGAYNLSLNGSISIPLKRVTTGRRSPMNLNFNTSVRYSRDVSKLNKTLNYNYTTGIGQRIRFDYNIPEKLDVGIRANFNYNNASYSLQNNQNNRYFNQSYAIDLNVVFFKNLMFDTDFDYFLNTGRSAGFNQSVPLWNASLSYLLFKKRNGELKFGVVDILNQNKNIDRVIGDRYIEDTYTEALRRFYMVTFMYSLNRFGGKGNQNRNGGGGGGMQRGGSGGGGRNRF